MSDIHTIKNLRNNHGHSVNKISKDLNINWRTAKKYADPNQLPKESVTSRRGMMYQEKWGEIVSGWLSEDYRLKKKSRRTALAIFKELKALGFEGSYRTVCSFIECWKDTHQEERIDQGFERLEHPPGEAQVDFGTMEVVQDGEFKDVHLLIMTMPYSNAAFAVGYPAENQECFLDGLQKLFEQAKGVPRAIRIDNLSPAIKKRKSRFQQAELTHEFQQFQNFYGFDVQVCNPRSGNEKGSVENKVGYIRYNFFPTAPVINSWDQLNELVSEKLTNDLSRPHYIQKISIKELWQEEYPLLLALPAERYPVFKETQVRANKYNEILVDNWSIHVPFAKNHACLTAIFTWDTVKVVSPNGEILKEEYRPYMNKKRSIPWTMILKDWKNKMNVMEHSRYWKYLPFRIQNYLNIQNREIRYARLNELLSLLTQYELSEISANYFELIGQESATEEYPIFWEDYDKLVVSKEEPSK